MAKVTFDGRSYECGESSVLDSLNQHGVLIPSSCRSGICQTCLMRAVKGRPPAAAQKGLKETLKAQNYFLACACIPEEDLDAVLPGAEPGTVTTHVESITPLNEDIVRVRLELPDGYTYKPGQFLNLYRDDGVARSYSIASLPGADDFIELHVRKILAGRMSIWVHECLSPGDTVRISEAHGDCFYTPGDPEQGLLLIGTGSGLAPLYGIVRDALAQGHTGPVWLFHGSRDVRGLYLVEAMRDLQAQQGNFHYRPCTSGREWLDGGEHGRADEIALRMIPDLKHWRVYLCGHPDMVKATKRKVFLAGATMSDIYSDPFSFAPPSAVAIDSRAG